MRTVQLVSTLALCALIPVAAARGAEPSPPPAPGWIGPVVLPAAAAECSVSAPEVSVRLGVSTLATHPIDYPRPRVECAGGVEVPLLRDSRLLQRVERTEPMLAWTPRLRARPRGSDVVVVDIDVPPLREAARPSDSSVLQPIASEPSLRKYDQPRWRQDPSRLPGGATPTAEPPPPAVPPALSVQARADVEADAVVIGTGGTWISLALALDRSQEKWYRLGETEMFGAGGRLIVAPTPRHPRALLELLVVDPVALGTSSLGRPAPPGASWRQEVSDLREREGALEVILIERDPSPKGADGGQAWGAVLRSDGAAWTSVTVFNLPDSPPAGSVRFDASDPTRVLLVLDGLAWTRPLP